MKMLQKIMAIALVLQIAGATTLKSANEAAAVAAGPAQEQFGMLARRKQMIDQAVNQQLPGPLLDLISGYDVLQWTMPREGAIWAPGGINCCAATSDGRYLAVGTDKGSVHLVDCDTWESVKTFQIPDMQDVVWHISFSPNNRYIAYSVGMYIVQIRSVESGELLNSLDFTGHSHKNFPSVFTFSPDSQRFILGYGSNIYYYKLNEKSKVFEEKAHFNDAYTNPITNLIFVSNMTFVSAASQDLRVKMWKVVDGNIEEVDIFEFKGAVTTLAYSSMRELLAVGTKNVVAKENKNIHLFKIIDNQQHGQKLRHMISYEETMPINQCLFSVDQQYLIGRVARSNWVYIIDVMHPDRAMRQQLLQFPQGHTVHKIIFSPDNQYTVGLTGVSVLVFENFLVAFERAERRVRIFNGLNKAYNNFYNRGKENLERYDYLGDEALIDKEIAQLIIKNKDQARELLQAIKGALQTNDWVDVDYLRSKAFSLEPSEKMRMLARQRLQRMIDNPNMPQEKKGVVVERSRFLNTLGIGDDEEYPDEHYSAFLSQLLSSSQGDFLDDPSLEQILKPYTMPISSRLKDQQRKSEGALQRLWKWGVKSNPAPTEAGEASEEEKG